MTTRVRVINDGDQHHIIVGSPTERHVVDKGQSITLQVGEKHPIVITEYEADLNELNALVLPKGFRQ